MERTTTMKRRVGVLAIALTISAVGPAVAQDDGPVDAQEQDGAGGTSGMDGMSMGRGMMQGDADQHQDAMQMMMHCMSMMQGMHGEDGAHGHGDMGGSNGMNGMGMFGAMGADGPADGFDASSAEALAKAFVRGKAGDDAAVVEILDVTLQGGEYRVGYRRGSTEGTVLVAAATGEVTEAEDR